MGNQIIQDYGLTVTPRLYIDALQGHQYIPQADQCIENIIIKDLLDKKTSGRGVLDVGCGPGRLTPRFVCTGHAFAMGIDISQSFIDYAKSFLQSYDSHQYYQCDFARDPIPAFKGQHHPNWDFIVMQSVMHHIHGEDRAQFFKRSFELLKSDGILIIGDEFITDYETKDERILNVAKFYLHIIDEARKGGFNELAKEEAKNLIDDCFSGTKFAGLATEKTLEKIYHYAKTINEMFYSHGSVGGLNFDANNQIHNMFTYIKLSVEHLVDASAENFNRGDYKVSINVFAEEASLYGFKLEEKYEIGPIKQLGGMGVLVFKKK